MRKEREAVAGLLLRLRELGIMNHRLLSAFEKVPRRNFVPIIYHDEAYHRGQFPIECGQMMTSVDKVARALHGLDVPGSAKVLELGTGSGYQTALLAFLGGKVISMERYRTLCEKARIRMKNLGIENAQITYSDGSQGSRGAELFDRIISNCSFDTVPKGFLDQLSSDGVMVAPIGPPDDVQNLTKLTKIGSRFEVENLFEVRCQPFTPGISQAI